MNVVLISTYDLGHQPLGLASPAAWLRARGHHVTCVDLAVSPLPSLVIREADAAAFFLPMHTATRLAADAISKVKLLNPQARLLAYGLYAPLNAEYLKTLGVDSAIGGEYEQALADALESPAGARSQMDRLAFVVPDRGTLPPPQRYSKLHVNGTARTVAYTETSRGCKHLCRHCPVVPVYQGQFRAVPAAVVMADIDTQIAAGASHVTFGDPDFFNGPTHAMRIVEALHASHPHVTYDATIKVEHLLRHRGLLPRLRDTGCLFVTTAVESLDDTILATLEKGHTRADFFQVTRLFRETGLTLAPTFLPFTPWTTRAGYVGLLRAIAALELVPNVAPIQLALRLLLPAGSRLLELEEIRAVTTGFDPAALLHRWRHADPRIDALGATALRIVNEGQKSAHSRQEVFTALWRAATDEPLPENYDLLPRAAIPYMDEPWYC